VEKQKLIVDISDAKVSGDLNSVLVTYSLGSCIGVSLYDSSLRVGGMLHYQLPSASLDAERAKAAPFMFADTGLQIVLNKLSTMGVVLKRLKVKIAGGAAMAMGPQGFDIGKRNYLAVRKILWQHGVLIDGEDVGGSSPRNLYLDINDGSVTVRSNGSDKKL
jgi:chemotaxis protein CheD